eukprot:1184719-Alexandrium_andersonii.AAC.1
MGWSWAPFLVHTVLCELLDSAFHKEGMARVVHGRPAPPLRAVGSPRRLGLHRRLWRSLSGARRAGARGGRAAGQALPGLP